MKSPFRAQRLYRGKIYLYKYLIIISMEIKDLSPKQLWQHFAELNAVPRASKKEERVIAFMMDFGKRLGLETTKDAIGNVVIKKPATPGMDV